MAARFLDRAILDSEWGEDEVQRLADEAAADGGTADAAVEAAMLAADAEVIARMGGRYTVSDLAVFDAPANTSQIVQEHAAAYAIHKLVKRHDVVSQKILDAVARADKFLAGVASGRNSIGLPDAPTVDQTEALFYSTRTPGDEVFGDLDRR